MPSLPISLIHPTGNPFARNAAIALAEVGLLQDIITTIAHNPQAPIPGLNWLPPHLRQRVQQELGRRTWVPPPGSTIRTHPWREVGRLGLARLGYRLWGPQGPVDWVYASLDRHVAQQHLQGLSAVYAYEDGAADTFEAAKSQGIRCFYDLPIAFYATSHQIQAEEAERFPELAIALQATREPAWKIDRKHQEVTLADHIFVPSSFVQRSLLAAGVGPERISVIPFGAPVDYLQPQPRCDRQFQVLFVGRVGPRKGVHYLLSAWMALHLPQAELLLVGLNEFPGGWLERYADRIRYVPSVPHAALGDYYNRASVLVLPSLVEGLPLVLLEAMACGIPVITTPNAAGPEVITDGVEGWIVPIRDPVALQEKLEWCYRHPEELAEMGRRARLRAEQLTWELYRQRLGDRLRTELTR